MCVSWGLNRILWRGVTLVSLTLAILQACEVVPASRGKEEGDNNVALVFRTGNYSATKSESPDEGRLTDLNLFIFNGKGLLEKKIYFPASSLNEMGKGVYSYQVQLLKDCAYSIYVCANMGFELKCETLKDLLEYRFYMAYPDDYRIGVPMSGVKEEFVYDGTSQIEIYLQRAMAKVSLSVDRSQLDDDVNFNVTSVKVGSCPKSVNMFTSSKVTQRNDIYTVGFNKSDSDVAPLNMSSQNMMSGEISLYMFENIQGSPLGEITDFNQKEFDGDDVHSWQCSYIEITGDYISDNYYSSPGKGLVYRFYLGESPSDFNVQRNSHYRVTVCPQNSGIEGEGWRVDKTNLVYCGPVDFSVYPANFITGKIGDVIHVYCELTPEDTPFEISQEELDDATERGIYDYKIDEDGRGVQVTLTKSGTGSLYFTAGEPINDSALVIIVVALQSD